MNWFSAIVFGGILLKWAVQLWLERLNERNVRAHSAALPEPLQGTMSPATYARAVEYTFAKTRLRKVELSYDTVVLVVVLFSGILPRVLALAHPTSGGSPWTMGLVLFLLGTGLSLLSLPFDWYAQFRLEARFGFNTTTPGLWWADRLKGLCLGFILGVPLLVFILYLVNWTGRWWWFWAWVALLAFQLVMAVLAPVLILPLFNKFTPLPEGTLRARLLALAQRTAFRASQIQVMDGSKRSRHSNAFFTGFGRFRKIVLFDTLIQQLHEPELEAVLAHEIGHYKKQHLPKMLLGSATASLAGFYLLSWLAGRSWFFEAFEFEPGSVVPALVVCGLLAGVLTFWFSPLPHWWSRRCEYEADAFAAAAMEQTRPLIEALRKLNEQNLSNLTPHPLYSGFYYSHPTLLERESALRRLAH